MKATFFTFFTLFMAVASAAQNDCWLETSSTYVWVSDAALTDTSIAKEDLIGLQLASQPEKWHQGDFTTLQFSDGVLTIKRYEQATGVYVPVATCSYSWDKYTGSITIIGANQSVSNFDTISISTGMYATLTRKKAVRKTSN